MILLDDRLFSFMTLILFFSWDEKLQMKLRGEGGTATLSENNVAFWCWYLFRASGSHAQSSLLRKALSREHGKWPYAVDLTAEITQIGGREPMKQRLRWLASIPTKSRIEFRPWDSEHSAVCSPQPWELGCELPLKPKVNPRSTASARPTSSSCWDI